MFTRHKYFLSSSNKSSQKPWIPLSSIKESLVPEFQVGQVFCSFVWEQKGIKCNRNHRHHPHPHSNKYYQTTNSSQFSNSIKLVNKSMQMACRANLSFLTDSHKVFSCATPWRNHAQHEPLSSPEECYCYLLGQSKL